MKKLLVLSLVLAVAGLANAGIALVADGNMAKIVTDDQGDYFAFLAIDPSITISGFTLHQPPAGPGSSVDDTAGVVEGFGRLIGVVMGGGVVSGNVVKNQPGIQFTLTGDKMLTDVQNDGPKIVMYNDSLETVLGTLYVVPEPMTMGLLGLGALFLRKRK